MSRPERPRRGDAASRPLSRDPIAEAQANWERAGWLAAAAPMAAVTAIVRTEKILTQRIEAVLKPHGLTFARFEVLALLNFTRTGAMAMSRASRLLQVHPTSVTNAVDRLEQAALVTRSAHATDGRTTLITLTARGREALRAAAGDLNARVFEDSGFTPQDIADLARILARFRHASGDFDVAPPPG